MDKEQKTNEEDLTNEEEDLVKKIFETEDEDPREKNNEDQVTVQLENIEREKKGLLKELQKERQKRQELAGRLNQVTETVNTILEKRLTEKKDEKDNKPSGIPVEFTEDGDAFVPVDHLRAVVAPYEEKINELTQQLQAVAGNQDAEKQAEQIKASIIGEDERFQRVYPRYQAARKWVADKALEFIQRNGINRPLTSGEVLDHVVDENIEQEFKNKFPDLDIAQITIAEDSQLLFRKTLESIANKASNQPDNSEDLNRFQKVVKKPAGVSGGTGGDTGTGDVLERISKLSTEDIANLSDAQIEALQKALELEEKQGIKW